MERSVSGVGVLDKAVAILGAVERGPRSLAELSEVTGIPRATAHRLASALADHDLLGRDRDGRFVLGSGLVRLAQGAGRDHSPTLVEAAGPALARLRDATGESVQLFVRSGDVRVCLLSLESPHSLRTIVAVGAALPMDRGSAAKVLAEDPSVLARGWAQSVEERERGVASISAPVVVGDAVVAAVSVSGPIDRTTRSPARRYADAVVAAARDVESRLGRASRGPSVAPPGTP